MKLGKQIFCDVFIWNIYAKRQGILDTYSFILTSYSWSLVYLINRDNKKADFHPDEWQSKWKEYPECIATLPIPKMVSAKNAQA